MVFSLSVVGDTVSYRFPLGRFPLQPIVAKSTISNFFVSTQAEVMIWTQ